VLTGVRYRFAHKHSQWGIGYLHSAGNLTGQPNGDFARNIGDRRD
jgi:hypothetical protein